MEIFKRTKKTTSNKLILTLPDRLIKEKVEITVELKDKNKQSKKSSNVKNKVTLEKILLKGPTITKEELMSFKELRKDIIAWRKD
jgi:hypothetical protein